MNIKFSILHFFLLDTTYNILFPSLNSQKEHFIGVQLLYNVALVCAVSKSTSVIHINTSTLFQISFPGHCRVKFPVLHSQFSLVIYLVLSPNTLKESYTESSYDVPNKGINSWGKKEQVFFFTILQEHQILPFSL